ncbi:MAG: PspC domain-containing protein [Bacteroidales bacterium]|nr:PspC domain-containing protein [Bacteroidales bacterium]
MKKTFSININGVLFNIDEDAFEKLNDYLKTLKKHFKNTEGGDDIVNDIEARLAEILKSRILDLQHIVTINDVDFIIETLGQPFEIDDESETDSTKKSKKSFAKKRIFRDPDNQIFGGVASGLGTYFNIDFVIIRLIFILSILAGGVGIIVYLTLWILTPMATTTAEKIEMEGEKVDIKSIEKKVGEELESLKVRFQDFSNEAGDLLKKKKIDSANGINQFGQILYNIFRVFIRVLTLLIGIIFLVVGTALILTLAVTYLGLIPTIHFEEFSIGSLSLPSFLNNYIITTPYELILNVAIFLVLFIPVVGLIFNGIRLIFNFGRQKIFDISAIVLWFLATMVAFTLSVKTMEQFKTESKQIVINTLDSIQSDTLNLAVLNQQFYKDLKQESSNSIYLEDEEIMFSSKDSFYGNSGLTFSRADGENFELLIRKSAKGENTTEAKERIERIKTHYVIKGNSLEIDPYYTLVLNEKWRCQEVTFEIKVPEGKTLFIDKKTRNYFQWHYWYQSKRKMSGKYWLMTENGLEETMTN